MSKYKLIGWLAGAAAATMVVGTTAGCHDNTSVSNAQIRGEAFVPDTDARAIWNLRSVQAAAGARQDATLYDRHFDAEGLNTLGQQKLDLMLADSAPADPLVVYLDIAPHEPADHDRAAVLAYLKDRGLSESQVDLKTGPNPRSATSADKATQDLKTLQATPAPGAGAAGASTGAGGSQSSGFGH